MSVVCSFPPSFSRTLPELQLPPLTVRKRSLSPPTPIRKKARVISSYIEKINALQGITWNGQYYPLGKLRNEGSYSNVYPIRGLPKMIIKKYKEEKLSEWDEAGIKSRYESIADQYWSLAEMTPDSPHAHQAQIFNLDTAQDDGYLIIEYLPYPFPAASWDTNTKFESLLKANRRALAQIKTMFQYIADYDSRIHLKRDTVRMDAQSQVKLFKWDEEPSEQDESESHLKTKIESFARGIDGRVNPDIFAYLCPKDSEPERAVDPSDAKKEFF